MNDMNLRKAVSLAGTPCYVLDGKILRDRVEYIRRHLPSGAGLCYAMKANPFLVGKISPFVDRIEICSPGEWNIARKMGVPGVKLVVSGVNKQPDRIRYELRHGSGDETYTAESVFQLESLSQVARNEGKRLEVLLRLTSGNQFGLREDEIEEIIRTRRDDPWLIIRGIQYYSGTQKRKLSRLKQEMDHLDGFLEKIENLYGPVRELEYGPGFPVSYFQGDDFDEEAYLNSFAELLEKMRFPGRIMLELGRSLVADCGHYLTRIADRKTIGGQNYAIADGGIHQITYFGQSMAMRHPYVRVLDHSGEGEVSEWNIFGSLCTVNDVLVKRIPLNSLKIGDILVFEKAGAYCITEGISLFLSRELPAVVWIPNEGEPVCFRTATPTDPFNTPVFQNL